MRKITGWMVLAGALLIIGGAVGAGVTLYNNIPSPFDVASAAGGSDNSLPIVAPAASSGGSAGGSVQEGAPTVNAPESYVPAVTPQPAAVGLPPDRLVIPAINLDASIIPVSYREFTVDGKVYYQWLSPDQYVVGWQNSSALLGLPGNTVFNGHHNSFGRVFKDLVKLNVGDEISVFSGTQEFRYQVVAKMLLPERQAPLSTRLQNARWIETSTDQRITLITCWPADSNTHRVVIVAFPIGGPSISSQPAPSSQTPMITICYNDSTRSVDQSNLDLYPNYKVGACPSQTTGLTIQGSESESSYTQPGDVLHFSYLITNSTDVTMTDVGVTNDKTTVGCPKTTLEPGDSMTCKAVYYVKYADATAKYIVTTATATAKSGDTAVESLPDSQTVIRFLNLTLSSQCSADPTANDGWQVKNNNPYAVDFEYDFDGGVAGVGIAPANSTVTFDTPVGGRGTGVMTLYVGGLLQNNAIALKGCN